MKIGKLFWNSRHANLRVAKRPNVFSIENRLGRSVNFCTNLERSIFEGIFVLVARVRLARVLQLFVIRFLEAVGMKQSYE